MLELYPATQWKGLGTRLASRAALEDEAGVGGAPQRYSLGALYADAVYIDAPKQAR